MIQPAKKLVSDSQGASGFCYWAVNSVLKLPDGQVKFFEEFMLQKNCNQSSSLSLHPDDYLKLSWPSTLEFDN